MIYFSGKPEEDSIEYLINQIESELQLAKFERNILFF